MTVLWTDAELNAQADYVAGRCAYVSIHTGDPSGTGALEAAGGSPAYARKAATFSAAGVEGPLGASQPATVGVAWGSATFDLPAGDYTHYGHWSAATGGTFRGSNVLPASPFTLADQGTVAVSVAIGPNV